MYDTTFIITILIAVYLLFIGLAMNTSDFASVFFFKLIPIVAAFYLGLHAFKIV